MAQVTIQIRSQSKLVENTFFTTRVSDDVQAIELVADLLKTDGITAAYVVPTAAPAREN